MLRKGFTLIELLIVITIIAILAGAAIPYVADYVDEGRSARAKQDMSEIRNALVRWELERGPWLAANNSIEPLVGPFLSQLLIDPWGSPYEIQGDASRIRSNGPDGTQDTGDDLALDFRPPMAVTKMEYVDVNRNGVVDIGDGATIYCTRPVNAPGDLLEITFCGTPLNTWAGGDTLYNLSDGTTPVDGTEFRVVASFTAAPGFSDNDIIISAVGTAIGDPSANEGLPTQFAKEATLKLKSTGW